MPQLKYGSYDGVAPRIALVLTPLNEENLLLAAQVGATDIVYYNMDSSEWRVVAFAESGRGSSAMAYAGQRSAVLASKRARINLIAEDETRLAGHIFHSFGKYWTCMHCKQASSRALLARAACHTSR